MHFLSQFLLLGLIVSILLVKKKKKEANQKDSMVFLSKKFQILNPTLRLENFKFFVWTQTEMGGPLQMILFGSGLYTMNHCWAGTQRAHPEGSIFTGSPNFYQSSYLNDHQNMTKETLHLSQSYISFISKNQSF